MSARTQDARLFQQGQQSLVPVFLRESVLDSVTFRAAIKHFDDQLEVVDAWLNAYIKNTREFTAQFCRLEEQAVEFHAKLAPNFIESGLVDPDYTVTAMSRYSSANKAYWISIFANVRSLEQTVIEPLLKVQHHEIKEIRHLRNDFHKQQKAYDETLRYYLQQPKTKEASSLREDAFQLYEKRKSYIKSSFDYTIKISTFRAALDSALIAAFSKSFLSAANHTSALATDFASRPSMNRIISWAEEMSVSARAAEEHLYAVRFELEDDINKLVSPPRELSEYASSPRKPVAKVTTNAVSTQFAKQGWLMMRAITGKPSRYIWLRRWCYVKDGIFGWLSNNPKTGAVEESDRIGVLLCNVKIPALEDRRFTFEVLTKDSTILLQAESEADVEEWMAVFDVVKKAVLASKQSNDHAFSVTKPQYEFAAAHQALEGGHGESHTFDGIPGSPNAGKKSSGKTDASGVQGLSALVSATSVATNLAAPRMVGLFGRVEDQKFFNPFENTVDGNGLAPVTFAPAPINTHLTKESLLNQSTSVVHAPSGTQANHWGSINYGMLNATADAPLQGKGVAKLLAAPEAAIDLVYGLRDKELLEKGIRAGPKSYPVDYPPELKRQDAQFSSLFPHARSEFVVMVVRATRTVHNEKAMFSGRLYVTLRGLYFYSQSSGIVLLQTCLFSEILSVRVSRKVSCDILQIDIHDVGESSATLFLDDADLVKKRIELLLANYIADEPKGVDEMLTILQKTLPDDTNLVQRSATRERSAVGNSSDDEETGQAVRKEPKLDAVRLKLPSEPVISEPDDQMSEKIYDAEYMITAKGLFHLLFGNRSPVWLQAYKKGGLGNVQQGSWQTVEDGTLARAFKYVILYDNGDGQTTTLEQSDYQKISKREEHLDYTVVAYRRPWDYPNGSSYFLNVKMNISFVSKQKSRLRMWFDIDWKSPNYLSRGVIARAILDDMRPRLLITTHFIEREVLDRLGLQAKTSKAVRIYGRVGGHSESMYLDKENAGQGVLKKRITTQELIRRYPRVFFHSLLTEGLVLMIYIGTAVYRLVTANGLLIGLLLISLAFNAWITGLSSVTYWQHKSAVRMLDNIRASPIGLMSRGISLAEIDEIAFNATTAVPSNAPPGQCFETFEHLRGQGDIGGDYYTAFKATRDSMARSRNDLLVAIKVLNGMETEIVKGQWQEFVQTERARCAQMQEIEAARGGGEAVMPSDRIKSHCADCLRIA